MSNEVRRLFTRFVLLSIMLYGVTACAKLAWGQPGAKEPTPLDGELRAIIMLPEPGSVIRCDDAGIYADIAGVKSYGDVKKVEYYVDDKLVKERRYVPFSDGCFFAREFEDGVHLASARFLLKDGRTVGLTIPMIIVKDSADNKLDAWKKDVAAVVADKESGKKLFALVDKIVELNRKIFPAKLECEALTALLGKTSATKIPVFKLDGANPAKSLEEHAESLEKNLAAYNSSIAEMKKESPEKIKAAFELKRSEYKGKLSSDYLPEFGYNGRYFLVTVVKGVSDIKKNYEKLGANFFFGHPYTTERADEMLEYASGHNAYAVGKISRVPRPDSPNFPKERINEQGQKCDSEISWEDYRFLGWKYPRNFLVTIEEFGGSRTGPSVARAKRKPSTRLEAEENFVSAEREYLDYWAPAGIGVFSWDNFGQAAPQYEAGVDVFLSQLYRGQNLEIACASLRGDARAYKRYFGVSVTEHSWLAAPLDWGVKTENKDTVGALTSQPLWRYLKPTYSDEDLARLYYYSFFSGATVVGHEAIGSFYKGIDKYTEFLKKHPRMGLPETRVAVLRGLGDSRNLSVDGDDARYYAEELMWATDPYGMAEKTFNSDWGDYSHFNDYALFKIFYPDFGNAHHTWRQYTGSPIGQADFVSGLAPFGNDAYKVAMMISINTMTRTQAEKLRAFVNGGGVLIINAEQCRGDKGSLPEHCVKFLSEVAGVSVGEMLPEKNGAVKFAESGGFGFPKNKSYPAKHLKIRAVKLGSGKALASLDDGSPVCVANSFGKGTVFLTTTQWHWRLPFDFMKDLVERIVLKSKPPVLVNPANPFVETFLCKLADGKGASVALFNNQANHTGTQHFRKMFKHDEALLPGTEDKTYDVNLADKEEQVLRFEFETPVDFKKYDEVVLRCRADGDMPGGGVWVAFYDESGRKAWWVLGQMRVGKIVGERWFERFMTPQYPNLAKVGAAKADDNFDWRKVRKAEITLKRGKDNPPLRYKFHLKNMALLNLMTNQKLDVKRENPPYKGTVEVDAAQLGLDPQKIKVYAADADLNLSPVPSEVKDGRTCFSAQVDGDWKEYFLKEEN